jgi:hypothetical protein
LLKNNDLVLLSDDLSQMRTFVSYQCGDYQQDWSDQQVVSSLLEWLHFNVDINIETEFSQQFSSTTWHIDDLRDYFCDSISDEVLSQILFDCKLQKALEGESIQDGWDIIEDMIQDLAKKYNVHHHLQDNDEEEE